MFLTFHHPGDVEEVLVAGLPKGAQGSLAAPCSSGRGRVPPAVQLLLCQLQAPPRPSSVPPVAPSWALSAGRAGAEGPGQGRDTGWKHHSSRSRERERENEQRCL